MKIVAIRGKNLASLEGEFVADFAREPLASAGLFAITGPTGAGKSTLLDALCLSLFDKTPRMNRARENGVLLTDVSDKTLSQNDCRSLLRRGASEGYAETDFCAVNGQLFRARWSVRRARGRADGSLQPSEIRLCNLTTGLEEQGGKGELLRRIVVLLGLSFDQFTRAVLLAQGDFATFLKAPEEEKADLLEKLTGTEVYSQISQGIFLRTKEIQERYDALLRQMDFIALLTDDELTSLLEECRMCRQAEAEVAKRCDDLKDQMRWIEEHRNLLFLHKAAEAELEKVQSEYDQAEERRAYMGRYDLVQEIRDAYQTVRRCEENRKREQIRMETLAIDVRHCAQELEQREKSKNELEEQLSQLKISWESSADERRAAAELDTSLAVSKEKLDAVVKAQEKQIADLKQERNIRDGWQLSLEKTEEELARIEAWQAQNRVYEPVIARLVWVKELLCDLLRTREFLDSETSMQKKNAELLRENEDELKNLQEESHRLDEMLPSEVLLLRTRLVEGEPCPVCGSRHHCIPVEEVKTMQEQELEQRKKIMSEKIESLSSQVEYLRQAQLLHSSRIDTFTAQQKEKGSKLDEILLPVAPEWRKEPRLEERLDNYAAEWNDKQASRVRCQNTIESIKKQLPTIDEKIKKLESIEKNDSQLLRNLRQLHEELRSRRNCLLGGGTLSEVEAEYEQKSQLLNDRLAEENRRFTELKSRIENLNGIMEQLTRHLSDLQRQIKAGQCEVEQWLGNHDEIDGKDLSELFAHTPAWVIDEKKYLSSLQDRLAISATRCKERTEALLRYEALPEKPSFDTVEQLPVQLAEQTSLQKQYTSRIAEINTRLVTDQENRQKCAHIEKQRLELLPEKENWERLNKLFGSSDGVKFRRIAQGYTLDRLLVYANLHLQGLSSRYTLQRVPERLALQVADNDMMGEIRSVHTLSGGESFLISLALALGLSSLSSYRMNIESLFIDEGFGSLDAETLQTAMGALEHLQMQGRKIGVISHVVEMTERISVQVQVQRVANGRSRVVVVET